MTHPDSASMPSTRSETTPNEPVSGPVGDQPTAVSQPSPADLEAIRKIQDPLSWYPGLLAVVDIRRHATFWFWSLALAIGDLISKRVVFEALPVKQLGQHVRSGGSIPVIDGFFDIHSTCNYGAAFSLGTGQVGVLTIISSLVLVALVVWRHWPRMLKLLFGPIRDFPRFAQWGICLVFAGALGNLYDRLFYGYVRDFLDFKGVIIPFSGQQFPIFNLADSYLTVGIIMFLIVAWFFAPKEEAPPTAAAKPTL